MDVKTDYQDYPVFRGLQRPLEMMGLQGRYIYWAAGTAGGAVCGFIIGYLIAGFLWHSHRRTWNRWSLDFR